MNIDLPWLTALKSQLGEARQKQSSVGSAIKQEALESFLEKGFPHFKDEAWKYTHPGSFIKNAEPIAPVTETVTQVEPDFELEAHHIVFVDGQLDVSRLSNAKDEAFEIFQLNEAELPQEIEAHAQGILQKGDGLQSLALSSMSSGVYLKVKPNQSLAKPVVFHFIESGKEDRVGMSSPVCFVSLGAGAKAQVVEYSYSKNKGACWFHPLTSYRLDASAKLELLKMSAPHLESQFLTFTNVQQEKDSEAFILSIMSSGKILRNIINIEQTATGAFCRANGLGLVKSGEHFDIRSRFLHMAPHGTGEQLYKSVVSDKARFVFNGKIYIAKDAQKVDAQMLNKNLLLGRLAEADTKPELEVYADDVKAGHGASIGQLDVSELFYLMSRAISKRKALELLARAYVDELLLNLPSENLKSWASLKLSSQLEVISKQIEASLDENNLSERLES